MSDLPLGDGTVSEIQIVDAYHERTKNYVHRLAAGPGHIDFDTQPDLFRHYADAPIIRLPLPIEGFELPYWRLYISEDREPREINKDNISLFFRYALSLTAWKTIQETTFPLRVNPSSGNLHPTEGYALVPPIEGIHDMPGIYHYLPKEHALEHRSRISPSLWADLMKPFPEKSFLAGLTSIFWRQSWKYGERSFRFCQEDIGHALGTLRYAAAALGWKLYLLPGVDDAQISRILGLDRDQDYVGAEREAPTVLVLITKYSWENPAGLKLPDEAVSEISNGRWEGKANVLSSAHNFSWPAIDEVANATIGKGLTIHEEFAHFPSEEELFGVPVRSGSFSAEKVILGRRSAHKMDRKTAIDGATFFRMMARLVPSRGPRQVPWDAVPWKPRIHLGLFLHRVDGLPRGLYVLVRDPAKITTLQKSMRKSFKWANPSGCPSGLSLFLLKEGDYQSLSIKVSCNQNLAGDGAFSVSMFSEYLESLSNYGASFYRNLFWEAGLVGQVLYLESEEAGIGSSGIGAHLDESVHEIFGFTSRKWQSIYNFTVGGPVEDIRLTTLPAYQR